MKILKSLNKIFFIVLFFSSFLILQVLAEEKPIDIWNLDKDEDNELEIEYSKSTDNQEKIEQNSVYQLQDNKTSERIKLDEDLSSSNIKIVGLYDPQDYGLSINMWSNSDGTSLKTFFKNIQNFKLSKDASEIIEISLLTNAYYPNKNITEQEFISLKSEWLTKNTKLNLIEEYLIKNQIINEYPILSKHLVDSYLAESNIKKACEVFLKNSEAIQDDYLFKFNLYCLISYGKNEEAQLILDLKKEMGFNDDYFENKINYLFGYIEEVDNEVSVNSILDFHLAHRTNPEFSFEPNNETPKLIWRYLSASNLLYKIQDLEISDLDRISIIEKAVHDKIYLEEDLFEFYKKFQFNIDQMLNAKEVYKSLSSIEGRALLYQRLLLSEEPKLKLELMKILKNSFENEKIGDAFDLQLSSFLKQIDFAEVPSNYTTFYYQNLNDDIDAGKIKFNSKILHQSKLVNYFNGDYDKSKIEQDLEKFLMKIKNDQEYILSMKDIIFLEALKSDGINISNNYDDLYLKKRPDMPLDIQKMIENKEIGTALLRVIEEIGSEKIENINDEKVYLIINTLNQINADTIRNKLLLKVLPLKV